MNFTDPGTIARTVLVLLVGVIAISLIFSMSSYGETYSEKHTENIEQIIDNALVQCYALEGGYPPEIEYIEKYGVIINNDKYIYMYEWYGNNLKPNVTVMAR